MVPTHLSLAIIIMYNTIFSEIIHENPTVSKVTKEALQFSLRDKGHEMVANAASKSLKAIDNPICAWLY